MIHCNGLDEARRDAVPGEFIMFSQAFPVWDFGTHTREYRAGGPSRVYWAIASSRERMSLHFPRWQTWEAA